MHRLGILVYGSSECQAVRESVTALMYYISKQVKIIINIDFSEFSIVIKHVLFPVQMA